MDLLRTAERAALHVSASQVKTYLICPKRYCYRYVMGAEPEHVSANLVLGTAVHSAIAQYYLALMDDQEPEESKIFAEFRRSIAKAFAAETPVLLDDGQTKADLTATGETLIRTFLANVERPDRVLAVETAFYADVADPQTGEFLEEQLTGFFDAVVQFGDKTVVLEHKTAARAWSKDQLDFDLQVSLYQAVTGADSVRLQVVTKTKVAKFLTYDLCRTERQLTEGVEIVCGVLTAIRARAFFPNPGWGCDGCEFKKLCRG